MLAESEPITRSVEAWLAKLRSALATADDRLLELLFHRDSYWRDVLALTWSITTVHGSAEVIEELKRHACRLRPGSFRTDKHRTAPRQVTRAGTDAIEAFFGFETTDGRGSGVLRLAPDPEDGGALKAWTLLTALDELRGSEEQVGRRRPRGESYARDFAARTGSISADPPPPIKGAIRSCWWSAAGRPACRSPRA